MVTVVPWLKGDPARLDEAYVPDDPSTKSFNVRRKLDLQKSHASPPQWVHKGIGEDGRGGQGRVCGSLEAEGRAAGQGAAVGGGLDAWGARRSGGWRERGVESQHHSAAEYIRPVTSPTPPYSTWLMLAPQCKHITSDPMPPNLHRVDSDMTHISDSEPEREARRRAPQFSLADCLLRAQLASAPLYAILGCLEYFAGHKQYSFCLDIWSAVLT
ncbi:hypothetical protein FB451DRAFT_1169602 [Mycena latifolia]|nr:hypothetical protein FB451DRAFT_1169602 [Mycena latifolia]